MKRVGEHLLQFVVVLLASAVGGFAGIALAIAWLLS